MLNQPSAGIWSEAADHPPRLEDFLRSQTAGTASPDLFVVRKISFKLLYSSVILRHPRRRLVSIRVIGESDCQWIPVQVIDALPWDVAPGHSAPATVTERSVHLIPIAFVQ